MVTTLTLNHADCDATDSKRVSCLMAAFKRGHVKICKFLVKHVRQFPSDQDCQRYVNSILSTLPPSTAAVAAAATATTTPNNQQQQQQSSEKDLVKRCQQCMEVIVQAKDKQAQEANRNASLLLKEIDAEKSREQSKKAAAQRKREKRKLKKMKQGNKAGPDSGELTNESAPSSAAAPSDGKTDQQQNESESEDEEDEGDRDDFAKTSLSSNSFHLFEIIL